jgi:hypothetical protein
MEYIESEYMTTPLPSNNPKPPPTLTNQGTLGPSIEPNRIPFLQLHHPRLPRISPTTLFGFYHPDPLGFHPFVPTIADRRPNIPKVSGSIAPNSSASGIQLQEKTVINMELLTSGERNKSSIVCFCLDEPRCEGRGRGNR